MKTQKTFFPLFIPDIPEFQLVYRPKDVISVCPLTYELLCTKYINSTPMNSILSKHLLMNIDFHNPWKSFVSMFFEKTLIDRYSQMMRNPSNAPDYLLIVPFSLENITITNKGKNFEVEQVDMEIKLHNRRPALYEITGMPKDDILVSWDPAEDPIIFEVNKRERFGILRKEKNIGPWDTMCDVNLVIDKMNLMYYAPF